MGGAALGYQRTEQELRGEAAAVLGRLGGMLEGLLRELRRLHEELPRLPLEQRVDRRPEYEALLGQACLYRFYLEVQREALGARDHRLLDVFYPPPRRLPARLFEPGRD